MKLHCALFICLSLFLNFENCLSDNLELLILHNNDMHSRFEETSQSSGKCNGQSNCYGGFARTAHIIREARKAEAEGTGPKVLYLNAGDTYSGTAWFNVHKWKIVSEFLNMLKPDVASFGNHEFDQNIEGLLPFLERATFPIVAANLDFSEEPDLSDVKKSVVLEIDGKKIGVIGYLTPDTALISSPGKVKFEDEVSSIKAESEKLDGEGVKIIIALGHSGYEVDQEIAKHVPLVDLVIGGHTDTFLWSDTDNPPDSEEPKGPYPTIITQSNGKEVPVVQAYAYTKYMGQLKISFDDNGDVVGHSGQPLLVDSTIHQEEDFLEVLEKYRKAVEDLDKEIVGRTKVILDGRKESCRYRDCNFANFITDAYVAYHSSQYGGSYWTDAPIAIINGGAIRATVTSEKADGSITRGELLSAIPFGDQPVSMNLKGSDILEALEHGVRSDGEETSRGEFLQVSGMRYLVDMSKPPGSRVSEVKLRCSACRIPTYQPLVLHHQYRIITAGFLNNGGDGHKVFQERGTEKKPEDLADIDTVAWYIEKMTPIYPGEEDRIVVVGVESY